MFCHARARKSSFTTWHASASPSASQRTSARCSKKTATAWKKAPKDPYGRPSGGRPRGPLNETAADQAHQPEEAPARPLGLAGHRADDAEALGRVVEGKADDQDERERDLVSRCRLSDREPFAEVVQADAGRDQEREPLAGGQPL